MIQLECMPKQRISISQPHKNIQHGLWTTRPTANYTLTATNTTLRFSLLTFSSQGGHVSSSTIACINTAQSLLAREPMTDQHFVSAVLTTFMHNRNFCLQKKFNSAEMCATVDDYHQVSTLPIRNTVLTT